MLTREINKVKSQKFNITADQAKKRLDKFLCEIMPNFSRAQIQKMIKRGAAFVDGKKVPVHHFLKVGEAVAVNFLRAHPHLGARELKNIPLANEKNQPLYRVRSYLKAYKKPLTKKKLNFNRLRFHLLQTETEKLFSRRLIVPLTFGQRMEQLKQF